jgi:DNA-binding Lrp family transcriptional regulator
MESSAMPPLDEADHRILDQLRLDGRIANARLAEAVGLSPSTCLRRLRALEDSGVIRGYTALIDLPGPEDATVIIVQITLERQTEEFLRKFEAAVRKSGEILECYLMTGTADYLLKVEVRSLGDYERIHTDVLSRLPGVARIQSNFTIRKVGITRRPG